MSGQEQKDKYSAFSGGEKITKAYTGPKKMTEAKNLLDGIEDLVSKDNLASKYKQTSAQ